LFLFCSNKLICIRNKEITERVAGYSIESLTDTSEEAFELVEKTFALAENGRAYTLFVILPPLP